MARQLTHRMLIGAALICFIVGCQGGRRSSIEGRGQAVQIPSQPATPDAPGNNPTVTSLDHCTDWVTPSYNSTVTSGMSENVLFRASGLDFSNAQGNLYLARSSDLSSTTTIDPNDFPSKFSSIAVTLDGSGIYAYVPQAPNRFTSLFTLSVPGGHLVCTPYLNINIVNSSGGGGGGGGGGGAAVGDVEVVVKDIDNATLSNFVMSFAHVFKDGDYRPGEVAAVIKETSTEVPIQVDVLRRDDAGFIRHAMISVLVPSITGQGQTTIQLADRAPTASVPAFVWPTTIGFNPTMSLTGSPGLVGQLSTIVTDPRACTTPANENGEFAYWRFNGPLMKQCVAVGKMRLSNGVINNEVDFSIRYTLRSGWSGIKIDFVVENGHYRLTAGDTTSVFRDFAFTQSQLRSGTAVLWTSSGPLTLWYGTRWRELGYFGTAFYDPEIRYNLNYLFQARAFDLMAGPTPYNYIDTSMAGARLWSDPNDLNLFPMRFGQSGGLWTIGPNRDDALTYMATWNRKAKAVMETNDSNPLSSNFEVFYRQSNGSTTQQKPGGPIGVACTLDSSGHLFSPWQTLKTGANNSPPEPDIPHQLRAGTTSYAFTGDLFYEEVIETMTMWNTASTDWPTDCIVTGPERAVAWSTRNLIDAAWLVPDNSPRKALLQTFVQKWAEYWAPKTYLSTLPIKVPEDAGNWGLDMSGRLTNVNAGRYSPWQYAWECWSFELAAKRGYSAFAPIRDWICGGTVDLFTAEDDRGQDFMITEYDTAGHPDTTVWSFPSRYAWAYSIADRLFYAMEANNVRDAAGNLIPCNYSGDPWTLIQNQPSRRIATWGEMWYYTYLNNLHGGWPVAHWCTNNDYSAFAPPAGQNPHNWSTGLHDGHQWSSFNGWGGQSGYPDPAVTGMRYSHEPSAGLAIPEAAWDTSATGNTTINHAKAQAAYQKYLRNVNPPTAIDLVPGVLE